MQEIKIHNLQERISVLKEKNIELEGVIVRWKDEVGLSEMLSQNLQRRSNVPSARYEDRDIVQLIDGDNFDSPIWNNTVKLEADEKLVQDRIHYLSDKVTSLEEINLQLKDRYEQSTAQSGHLREMLDSLLNEEGKLKVHSTRQITQLRTDLEIAHSEEMRRLRRVYEQDRQLLLGELKDIGNAVEDAHLLAADDVNGTTNEAEETVTKSKVFNNSIQRHIEAIEKDFSLSQSESLPPNQNLESEDSDSQWALRGISIRRLNKVDKQTETIDIPKCFSVSSQTEELFSDTMRYGSNERDINMFALRSEVSSNTSTPSHSIRDVYFDNLERTLAIERRKSEEARNEVLSSSLCLYI